MTRRLIILPQAEQDVQAIYDYIRERSSDGANRWLQAFLETAGKVLKFPSAYSLAPEDEVLKRGIRQSYSGLEVATSIVAFFVVVSAEVRVLRVRGPGQPPPSQDEPLSFKYYCTEPQTVILTGGDHHSVELEITASDEWQEMVLVPERLTNPANQMPLKDWSSIGKLRFQPKPGSDLTKVIFAEFKWAVAAAK